MISIGQEYKERYEDAERKLAALREELGQCKGEYDRSANRVSALQDEVAELEEEFDTLEHTNITLKQRLADAERRNSEHVSMLKHFAKLADVRNVGTYAMDYVAALNPNPEAASHDE